MGWRCKVPKKLFYLQDSIYRYSFSGITIENAKLCKVHEWISHEEKEYGFLNGWGVS